MWKSAAAQGLTYRGVVKSLFGAQIPAPIEALIECRGARSPPGTSRNPKPCEALKRDRPSKAGPQHKFHAISLRRTEGKIAARFFPAIAKSLTRCPCLAQRREHDVGGLHARRARAPRPQ